MMKEKERGMEVRCCLECGEPLKGRSDKKFCCDYCRNVYNNRRNCGRRRLMDGVNRKLSHNYRLLENLEGNRTRLSSLEKEGFARQFYTGSGGFWTFRYFECYDMRYRISFGYLKVSKNNNDDRQSVTD